MTEESEDPDVHEDISKRRETELRGLLDVHKSNVEQAHRDYPTPTGVRFQNMDVPAQFRASQKAEVIKKSSQAYNESVRAACARHRDEEEAA